MKDKPGLDAIAKEIHVCQRCALWETRTLPVPGQGPADARLMLIGEAPGKTEDEEGRPFAGAAGRVLDFMLTQAGLSREQVFITSVIKCRPPKNRNPRRQEVEACLSHLNRQMDLIKPAIIAVMGNVALQTLLGQALTISAERGKMIEINDRRYVPVYHPAAVLYNRNLESLLKSDFLLLARLIQKDSS